MIHGTGLECGELGPIEWKNMKNNPNVAKVFVCSRRIGVRIAMPLPRFEVVKVASDS